MCWACGMKQYPWARRNNNSLAFIMSHCYGRNRVAPLPTLPYPVQLLCVLCEECNRESSIIKQWNIPQDRFMDKGCIHGYICCNHDHSIKPVAEVWFSFYVFVLLQSNSTETMWLYNSSTALLSFLVSFRINLIMFFLSPQRELCISLSQLSDVRSDPSGHVAQSVWLFWHIQSSLSCF